MILVIDDVSNDQLIMVIIVRNIVVLVGRVMHVV